MPNLKTTIQYGFIIGLALAFLFLPYKDVQHVNEVTYTDYVHPLEYIVNTLRIGIGGGIVGVIFHFIKYRRK